MTMATFSFLSTGLPDGKMDRSWATRATMDEKRGLWIGKVICKAL